MIAPWMFAAGAVLMGAAPARAAALQSRPETLMILAGSERALTRFEQVARRCGLKGVSRVEAEAGSGTWIRVAGFPAQMASDTHLRCAARYLLGHLEGKDALALIGNAAGVR